MNEIENKIERIKDKINTIQEYLDYLEGIVPDGFEDYKTDLKTKAACERYVEKIAEACVDLAFLIIKLKKFKLPEDDGESFKILIDNAVLPPLLAEKMKELKGMRNVIAHVYGEVDDIKVYFSLTDEISNDVNSFLNAIKLYLGLK